MDIRLLDILACPLCKGALHYEPSTDQHSERLICQVDKLAYPVEDGIPMMLPEKAVVLKGE